MATEISFSLSGNAALDAALAALGDKMLDAAADAMRAEAEAVMLDSKQNYVPVDKGGGGLQGTGHVEPAQISGGNVSVRLAYGGPGTPYAEAIHEHLSEHSPPSWKKAEASGSGVHFRHGGPKFLTLPLLAAMRGMADRIAARLRSRLGM